MVARTELGVTRRRVDIIAPLDRLFDVEVDEPTWLRRVVAAVVPLIDDGFGVSAWVMQLPPAEMGFELIRQDWQDLLPKNLGEMHDEAGREEIDTAYRLSSGVDSLAQSYGRRFYESPLLKRWVHAQNIADAGGMHVRLGARTLIVSTILRRPAELPPAMKRYGAMLAGQMERA